MTNRRNFLKNASLFTLGSLMAGKVGNAVAAQPASPVVSATTASKNIGLQIYSLGGELFKDVPGGMKKLKQMGYATLELAGYGDGKVGGIDMMEFKKMVDDAGLKITSSHVNPPVGEYTKSNLNVIKDFWKKTADDHAKLGVKYLVQPGQPSTRSVEETQYVCEVFNEAGKIAKAAGFPFGYHNHDFEFAKVVPGGNGAKFGRHNPGESVYDIFLKNTDPSLVLFEMDVYWAVMGQADPVEYLQKYPDRIKLLHIKDRAVLGKSGMMNFESIFKQFYANGNKDYFVEIEGMPDGRTQFEGVKDCATYLLKAKFAK
ncbi:sugar phosphate isomerase/epimerase [Parabacteroides sp. AM08-6]|uniref:sugar phosphate isomerase/epimerase family protein n=1 Tax=Parabacteroides sp. AM08-6 TaxID=2292053 RepID=UPI000EFFFD20|nr:sugar phosphate isomerase/epimerase [Parabacteroides sp. AM08-6]RHJ83195.1 sugar phosphate isomerase/epimerase [Parabacteroides sp. AM08-6]